MSQPGDKVQYLKGVGPKIAKILHKLGVEIIRDLMHYFPRNYQDRTKIKPLAKLAPAELEIIKGEIIAIEHQLTRNRFSVLKVILADRTGTIQAVWFNQPYLARMFRKGMKLILSGKVEYSSFQGVLQLIVRDFEIDTGENIRWVPIYQLTEGLYQKKLRSMIKTALDGYLPQITDDLPAEIAAQYQLEPLVQAIATLHFPGSLKEIEGARHRLAFEELFFFQLGLGLIKRQVQKERGISLAAGQARLADFIKTLPFHLTAAQQRVINEIASDLGGPHPMNRLLQGDVGSGKTVVAVLAALVAVHNGYQAVIMAPTEILAQQHYQKISQLLKGQGVKIKLLTGTTQAKKSLTELGSWDLLIGTHALIQTKVEFGRLGLIIIDEQHRFGVRQRETLFRKGVNPHLLVMTATPIPRSLALTLYGDMDRSVIDELPPGRTPIKTYYVTKAKRAGTYRFLKERIKEGRQVYVVCPLVEESEELDLKAATDEAHRLQAEVFTEHKVGLIHGRMNSAAKDRVMKAFQKGQLQILVSTTVIEVGIDIPNATVMMIEHAERFGLSQLHQLRGRIGRGAEQSYCFLLAEPKTAEARERLKALLDSNDGFQLAEVDLRLRGPGEFYGTRQSGLPNFRVADIINDEKILRDARQAAFELIAKDEKNASHIWESQRQKTAGAPRGAPLN